MVTSPSVSQYMSASAQNQPFDDDNIATEEDPDCHANDGFSSIPMEEVQGMDRQDIVVGNNCDDQNKKSIQPVDGMLSVERHSAVK